MATVSSASSSTETTLPLRVSFNQDQTSFTVADCSGFRIYSCQPFRKLLRRESDDAAAREIVSVEMLFNCNMIAIVTVCLHPNHIINRVLLWDDHLSRCSGELCFRSEVKSIKLRRDRVVVVLLHKVLVYNLADLKLLHQIETAANPKGLCAVSQDADRMILVCPGLRRSQVRVIDYASDRSKFMTVHESEIACFALSEDGKRLATASSRGTLVRVFNASDGSFIQEVRRGADRAEIYCLVFSSTAEWLAASSDKGTIHIFKLKVEPRKTDNGRALHASLSFVKGVLPRYFSSEWSVAQFRPSKGLRHKHIVAFGHQKNNVIILGADGSFYRCQFDPVLGGEMIQLEYHDFLKPYATF